MKGGQARPVSVGSWRRKCGYVLGADANQRRQRSGDPKEARHLEDHVVENTSTGMVEGNARIEMSNGNILANRHNSHNCLSASVSTRRQKRCSHQGAKAAHKHKHIATNDDSLARAPSASPSTIGLPRHIIEEKNARFSTSGVPGLHIELNHVVSSSSSCTRLSCSTLAIA